MKLDSSFAEILTQMEKERGIPVKDLKTAIEMAFLSAYKKKFGMRENVSIFINEILTEISITSKKKVVEIAEEGARDEIEFEDAIKINPDINLDDEMEIPIDLKNDDFGRMAAQVAKQVITQKLRDAEKKQVYDEYREKRGQIVVGTVQRLEKNNVIVKLGKHEAVLMPSEQVPGEKFRVGDRLKLFVTEASTTNKASQILLSRANTGFVQKLFELEVPEIAEGTVQIKSIAREPGYRTKIAVTTSKGNLDPVGTCIGSRGARIRAVVTELMGEKIDIIKWNSNPRDFILNSLSPSKVVEVKVYEKDRSAYVIVPDDQLSLAIGKEGQNVRLAAQLTSFHIDIESESQAKTKALKR